MVRWVAGVGAAIVVGWLCVPETTRRERIRASGVVRVVRWYRALWLRWGAALAGWPHVVDVVMGAPGVETGTSPAVEVWRDGSACLVRYEGMRTEREPVLLVHAFVTRPWILDLTPEQSLVRALLDAGFDVFMLDWGDPGQGDAHRGLSGYATKLMAAERQVLAVSGAERLHLVGYCTGATMCLARLASWPHDAVGSMAAIAAPIDTDAVGGMQTVLTHQLLKPGFFLDGSGCVPAPIVREAFHLLRPNALRSVARGWRVRRNPSGWAVYGALARWVWEQRPIPGGLFFDLVDLFRTNGMVNGTVEIAGRPVDMSSIRTPILVAVAERDHIVPGESSRALARVPGLSVEMLSCPSGHVSMLAGSGARAVLQPGLLDWLRRSQPRKAARKAGKRIGRGFVES